MGKSQKDQILAYMQEGNSVTTLDAIIRFRCTRLSARIWELRAAGYPIVGDSSDKSEKFVRYYLKTEEYAG